MKCLPEGHIKKPNSLPLYHQADRALPAWGRDPAGAQLHIAQKLPWALLAVCSSPASPANTSTADASEVAVALGDQTPDTQSRDVCSESLRAQTTQILSQADEITLSCFASNIWNIPFAWASNQNGFYPCSM